MYKVFLLFLVIGSSSCWIFNDIKQKVVSRTFDRNPRKFTSDEVDPDSGDLRISFKYPGTKWCGAGNIADAYDDLGPEVEADKCCRDHDNCDDYIPAGESKHNLTNNAFYSRLACYCDLKFRQCLHDANTKTANKIGGVYFDLLGTECYRKDYLTTGCRKRGGWLNTKCLEYTYDKNSNPRYQWFDVPTYN